MKGYKGFDKNLQCRDLQYKVGETFEEKEAKLCSKGLHFEWAYSSRREIYSRQS
ncbi:MULTISPECIES: DUF7666 domain-containing protein [unclassified Bacteroides]|uniref:DUF7666 domain-containing protein n=1 Tax=unclassified Bacteroides TaxID=2646097 RepID=UPI003D7F3C42